MNTVNWDKNEGWLLETTQDSPTSIGKGIITILPTKVTLRKLASGLNRRIEGLVTFDNGHVEVITVHVYSNLAKVKVRKHQKITCAISTNIVRKRVFENGKHVDNRWTRVYIINVENIKTEVII